MTSINFERISFFLEQLREHISFQWISTLNINEIHQLEQLEYDYISAFPPVSTTFFTTGNSL
mgnify:CR=1 FL=1